MLYFIMVFVGPLLAILLFALIALGVGSYVWDRFSKHGPEILDRKRSKLIADDIITKINGSYVKEFEQGTNDLNIYLQNEKYHKIMILFYKNHNYYRSVPVDIMFYFTNNKVVGSKMNKKYSFCFFDSLRIIKVLRKFKRKQIETKNKKKKEEIDQYITDLTTDRL